MNDNPPAHPWRAIQCAPLQELIAAKAIEALGSDVCCPVYRMIRVLPDGRRREITIPFVKSYVFARVALDAETWHLVRGQKGVHRILMGSVTDSEVSQLFEHVGYHTGELSEEFRIMLKQCRPGDLVKLTQGPFGGAHGTIEDIDEKIYVSHVRIPFLGRNIVVRQPLTWCELVTARSTMPSDPGSSRSLRANKRRKSRAGAKRRRRIFNAR
jgi:transcription antitermination factor NusG